MVVAVEIETNHQEVMIIMEDCIKVVQDADKNLLILKNSTWQ